MSSATTDTEAAIRRLSDTMAMVGATMQRLPVLISAHVDLHPTRLAALRSVLGGRTRVSDVADATFLSVSAASRTVDALVEDGLLDRSQDPDNRRAVVLSLTPKGAALMEEVRDYFEALVREVAADIGVGLVDELAQALETFGESFGARMAAHEADEPVRSHA